MNPIAGIRIFSGEFPIHLKLNFFSSSNSRVKKRKKSIYSRKKWGEGEKIRRKEKRKEEKLARDLIRRIVKRIR